MEIAGDWNLRDYFSAFGAEDYQRFQDSLRSDVDTLAQALTEAAAPNTGNVKTWGALLTRLEDLEARLEHLQSYLECLSAADSRVTEVRRDAALCAALAAKVTKLRVSVVSALGQASEEAFAKLVKHESIGPVEFSVTRMRGKAKLSMPEQLESLAADLAVNGLSAWGRLYDQVSGTLSFELRVPGQESKRLPVSMGRSLSEDTNRDVRRAAQQGTAAAWEGVAETLAACLNAISGTRLSLYERRGSRDFLQAPLFASAMSRETLDAMFDAVRARQEMPRKVLQHKAQLLGLDKLAWCDLAAPLPTAVEEPRLSWEEGSRRVRQAFEDSYPALGAFSDRALKDRWIDYQSRPGKRPGGFCSSSAVIQQSRIFMTYNGASGDVQTLAHELGHAFHSSLMTGLRPWAQDYPMPLAETASTFAENLVTNAILCSEDTPDEQRKLVLETRLQDAEAFLLNIPVRFDFECALYERRSAGELSVAELCDLMTSAQAANYGEALASDGLDPWFWASKLHFYITGLSFYNFPYTFGYLFSMGLFARFLTEGAAFLPKYEALLRATGSANAEQVAAEHLDVDLTKPDFWNRSIDLVEADWQRFRALTR